MYKVAEFNKRRFLHYQSMDFLPISYYAYGWIGDQHTGIFTLFIAQSVTVLMYPFYFLKQSALWDMQMSVAFT